MHTLRDYLRKNERRIIAVNGFIAEDVYGHKIVLEAV